MFAWLAIDLQRLGLGISCSLCFTPAVESPDRTELISGLVRSSAGGFVVDSPSFEPSVTPHSFSPPPSLRPVLHFLQFSTWLLLSPRHRRSSIGRISCRVRVCWQLLRLAVTAVTLPWGLRPLSLPFSSFPPSLGAAEQGSQFVSLSWIILGFYLWSRQRGQTVTLELEPWTKSSSTRVYIDTSLPADRTQIQFCYNTE